LHTPHDHHLRLSRCACDHQTKIVGYSLITHLQLTWIPLSWQHARLYGASSIAH
jgi:hypothetical protein